MLATTPVALSRPQLDALLRLARGERTIEYANTRDKLLAMRLVVEIGKRLPGETQRREFELTEAGRRAVAMDTRGATV